jgi:hypothetical protein
MSVFAHLYRMTIASAWYDRFAEFQREYEQHCEASLRGSPRRVRRTLARRGVGQFQRDVYRTHGVWIPLRRIRVSFEREEETDAVDRFIKVYRRSMRYRGKHWSATQLPAKVIPYAKKRRGAKRAKARKRKRPKGR